MPDSSMSELDQKKTWGGRFLNLAARRLTHPRLALHLSLLGMILVLPALWIGLQFDDFNHRMTMLGLNRLAKPGFLGFLDVFSFLNRDQASLELAKNVGVIPWWTSSGIRLSFLRHLSTLTMWVDYKLWPGWPSLMHLHSILWYGALIAAATALYRRLMGVTVIAGLAALFYAVDWGHSMPAAWLANRYALVSTFFGILCLLSYDKWRREGNVSHGVLCPFYLALALLSGEMSLAAGAYLFAYALFLDGRHAGESTSRLPLSKRLLALWPCVIVFLGWAVVYRSLGYGTHGSGIYIDPVSDPLVFLKAMTVRAPVLLMGQWGGAPLDAMKATVNAKAVLIGALICVGLIVFILVPLIRKDRIARFWCTGMILSLIPVAATRPGNRLLMFVGIGAMGLLAQCVSNLKSEDDTLPRSRFWRIPAGIIVGYFVFVRLVLSPPLLSAGSYFMKPFGDPLVSAARQVLADPNISGQTLIMVNPPHQLAPFLIWTIGIVDREIPAGMRLLSITPVAVEIYRMDGHSIRMKIPGGLLGGFSAPLFRSLAEDPISVNQEFHVTGMTAHVAAMHKKSGPEEIVYRFSAPLEDKSLRWLQWRNCRYEAFIPPPVGQSVRLPAFPLRKLFQKECAGTRSD